MSLQTGEGGLSVSVKSEWVIVA